jgi:site-specific DNA-methyltransferase (adenine-specific)
MNIDLRLGDCLEVLKTIPDNSIDSVVTDPPYGLGFMGKEWDTFDKNQFGNIPDECSDENVYNKKGFKTLPRYKTDGLYQFANDWASECFRILKPGGHLLSFAGSRTYHKICMGIEDSGFEIRDQIMWVYGSGFPKSHNIGKAIDKIEGNEREVVGEMKDGFKEWAEYTERDWKPTDNKRTKGNSDWEGWGTSLKPAHEPIVMARKPLAEKSIAENVLKHGTGGINIDGSRIGFRDEADKESAKTHSAGGNGNGVYNWNREIKNSGKDYETTEGRFPANIIFDEEAGQLLDEQSGKLNKQGKCKTDNKSGWQDEYVDGKEVKAVERKLYLDTGGASRFFYQPKCSKKDANEGIDFTNTHPTKKPTDLMRYLINLVTPPNGTILDPFMGSGSTGKAAVRCGVNFIGIEKEQEYMDIAQARIEHEKNKPVQSKLFDK